jgi:guanine deaminase
MCLGAIKWANIKKVYYGATSSDADAIGFRDEIFYDELNIKKIKGLELINSERDACLEPFKLWQQKIYKQIY